MVGSCTQRSFRTQKRSRGFECAAMKSSASRDSTHKSNLAKCRFARIDESASPDAAPDGGAGTIR